MRFGHTMTLKPHPNPLLKGEGIKLYMEYSDDLRKCLTFIDSYWDKIIHPAKDSTGDRDIIPLPHSYITTNTKEFSHWNGAMFYWDNFFIFRGLIATPRETIIPKMVDNFIYLFKEYGVIPNAN